MNCIKSCGIPWQVSVRNDEEDAAYDAVVFAPSLASASKAAELAAELDYNQQGESTDNRTKFSAQSCHQMMDSIGENPLLILVEQQRDSSFGDGGAE